MKARIVLHPFADDLWLYQILEQALADDKLSEFTAVVAWAKESGLSRIRAMLQAFRARGGATRIILGIDEGGASIEGLRTGPLLARYRGTTHASHQATAAIGRAAQATSAPSRILTTARQTTHTTQPPSPAPEPENHATNRGQDKAAHTPGPLQATLHSLGITDTTLLTRSADLDHAGQRLLIDAADQLPPAPKRPPATTLNKTAATAALLNHALATDHQAAQLLRQPGQREREQPELEPEP
jgi:hypothetical protein